MTILLTFSPHSIKILGWYPTSGDLEINLPNLLGRPLPKKKDVPAKEVMYKVPLDILESSSWKLMEIWRKLGPR